MQQGEVHATLVLPVRTADRVLTILRAGTSFDGDPSQFYEFTLGGPLQLGAFDVGEFRGDHFVYASLGYLKHVGQLPDIAGGAMFLAGWIESGSAFDDFDAARFHTNLSAGLITETFLGPVTFAGSLGDGGSSAFYFSIGGRLFR